MPRVRMLTFTANRFVSHFHFFMVRVVVWREVSAVMCLFCILRIDNRPTVTQPSVFGGIFLYMHCIRLSRRLTINHHMRAYVMYCSMRKLRWFTTHRSSILCYCSAGLENVHGQMVDVWRVDVMFLLVVLHSTYTHAHSIPSPVLDARVSNRSVFVMKHRTANNKVYIVEVEDKEEVPKKKQKKKLLLPMCTELDNIIL